MKIINHIKTTDLVDILYHNETNNFDNYIIDFNNSYKIKLLFLRCTNESSWHCDINNLWGPDIEAEYIVDILTNDGMYNDIDFLSIPNNFDINKINNIDILVYSSNIYSSNYILTIIEHLKPSILFHLSDEYTDRYEYNNIFNKVKLVYRQYKMNDQNNNIIKCLPLGYHSWGKFYIRNNIKLIKERKYKWCFSGTNKGTREEMLKQLSDIQPHFNQPTQPFETTNMFNNSKYAFCPSGNINIECSRIYEAMYNGCIPIIISDLDKINNFKNMFEIELPCYFVQNIDEMKNIINNVSDDELQLIQYKCIDWCKNIGTTIRNNILNVLNKKNNIELFTNIYNMESTTNSNTIYYIIVCILLIIYFYIKFSTYE